MVSIDLLVRSVGKSRNPYLNAPGNIVAEGHVMTNSEAEMSCNTGLHAWQSHDDHSK